MMTFLVNNGVIDIFDCSSLNDLSSDSKGLGQWIITYAMTNPEFLNSEFWSNFVNADLQFQLWSKSFFEQNPNVTWFQFQTWFLEEPLNSTLQNELIADWADPNTVKPTSKFKNNTKLNSIYNNIKTASNFKFYLQEFEPTFSVAHLLFDVDVVDDPTWLAETSEPKNYWIEITLNKDKDWVNIPRIIVAETFMHEMIHAEIFRKLLTTSSTSQGNIDWNKVKSLNSQRNFPGLFDYYTRYFKGNQQWQHEAMAAHYADIMINFLKQVYGTHYSDLEYETVVWMDLQGTVGWNSLPDATKKLYIKTWNENYWLWEK